MFTDNSEYFHEYPIYAPSSGTILVNRGWVPRKNVDPKSRQAGQVSGTVELVGVVRRPEIRPQFSPKCKGDTFLYR